MTVLKLIAAALLFGCGFYAVREYRRHLRNRVEECESFLSFIEYMQREIGCRLRPARELLREYRDEVLRRVGFLGEDVKDTASAYAACEDKLSVGKAGRRILGKLFSDLGKSYKEGTLLALSEAKAALREYTEEVRESAANDVKLMAALIFGGVAGLLLLIL